MDDNGLIACEVAIPSLGVHLDNRNFYVPKAGEERFDGDEGENLAASKLNDAETALNNARSALGSTAGPALGTLGRRIARQRELLSNSSDAEARRSVTEEALHVQQELARMRDAPEHRRALLLQEIAGIEEGVADLIDKIEPDTVQRLTTLLYSAREEVRNENWKKVHDLIRQAHTLFHRALAEQPGFVVAVFANVAEERFAALDKQLHDRLVRQGESAIEDGDLEELRRVIGQIMGNRMPTEASSKGVAMLAGLLRH